MVQFIVQHKVVPAWITSCVFTARIMESYLAVLTCAQFIKHHEVFLKSVDQTLAFDHSNESHGELFLMYFMCFSSLYSSRWFSPQTFRKSVY